MILRDHLGLKASGKKVGTSSILWGGGLSPRVPPDGKEADSTHGCQEGNQEPED